MNTPRNCCAVIKEMLDLIPATKTEFISDLTWNLEDASYKAPEETIQWVRTQSTLEKHIPLPTEDWEFHVIHIFTTIPMETLRRFAAEASTKESAGDSDEVQ